MNNRIYHNIINWIKRHKEVSNKIAHTKYCTEYNTFTFPVPKDIYEDEKLELFLPSKYPKGSRFLIKKELNPFDNRVLFFNHLEKNAISDATSKYKKILLKKFPNCPHCDNSLVLR